VFFTSCQRLCFAPIQNKYNLWFYFNLCAFREEAGRRETLKRITEISWTVMRHSVKTAEAVPLLTNVMFILRNM
jgi:hypothetical protein